VKTLSVLAAVLAVTGLSAQDASGSQEARLLLFGELVRPQKLDVGTGITDQASNQMGGGLRFMGQIKPGTHWFYELAGRLESSSNLSNIPGVGLDNSKVKVTWSYFSMGGGYLAPLGNNVDLGFHLEARSENIRIQGTTVVLGTPAGVDAANTFLRPWVRLSLDTNFQLGSVRPIIGGDVAFAALRTSQNQILTAANVEDRTARAAAPQVAVGFYVGLKF